MTRLLLSWLTAAVIASPVMAADADPDPKSLAVPAELDTKSRELIRQLAKASYPDREQAHRELRNLGRMALPAIEDALANSSSAEVQLRCEMLLARAVGEDVKARVECFLADAKAVHEHKLPGAKEYFAVVGKSESSRNLFRELILSANQPMLFAIGKPEDLAKAIAARRAQFRQYAGDDGSGRSAPNATDIAAILLAESCAPDVAPSPRNASLASQFINQPAFRTALDSGQHKDAYVSLFTRWIETREDTYSLYYAMNLSTTLKLTTGMKCAKKLLEVKAGPGTHRGRAMAFIAKNGDAGDVKILEPYLTDKAVIITTFLPGGQGVNKRIGIQARDVALAMCALMQKQDPADFGLTARSKSNVESIKFSYSQYYIDDTDGDGDKKRDEGIKKYEEWKAADKKKN